MASARSEQQRLADEALAIAKGDDGSTVTQNFVRTNASSGWVSRDQSAELQTPQASQAPQAPKQDNMFLAQASWMTGGTHDQGHKAHRALREAQAYESSRDPQQDHRAAAGYMTNRDGRNRSQMKRRVRTFAFVDTNEGAYRHVRHFLQEHGWRQVPVPSKHSNNRSGQRPDLIWTIRDTDIDYSNLSPDQSVNHFQVLCLSELPFFLP